MGAVHKHNAPHLCWVLRPSRNRNRTNYLHLNFQWITFCDDEKWTAAITALWEAASRFFNKYTSPLRCRERKRDTCFQLGRLLPPKISPFEPWHFHNPSTIITNWNALESWWYNHLKTSEMPTTAWLCIRVSASWVSQGTEFLRAHGNFYTQLPEGAAALRLGVLHPQTVCAVSLLVPPEGKTPRRPKPQPLLLTHSQSNNDNARRPP